MFVHLTFLHEFCIFYVSSLSNFIFFVPDPGKLDMNFERTIVVRGIPVVTSIQEVKGFFKLLGDVEAVFKRKERLRSSSFFVVFTTAANAAAAISASGEEAEFKGATISIAAATESESLELADLLAQFAAPEKESKPEPPRAYYSEPTGQPQAPKEDHAALSRLITILSSLDADQIKDVITQGGDACFSH